MAGNLSKGEITPESDTHNEMNIKSEVLITPPDTPKKVTSQVPEESQAKSDDDDFKQPFTEDKNNDLDDDDFKAVFGPDHDISSGLEGLTGSTESTDVADALLLHGQQLSTRTAIDRDDTPTGLADGINLHDHQKVALHWLKKQEADVQRRGGILADEMGLGKTIEMIALMVSRQHPESPLARANTQAQNATVMPFRSFTPAQRNGNATTLIVAPASLLRQWNKEIHSKTNPTMNTYISENSGKARRITFEIHDVVIVSYESLARDYDRSEKDKNSLFFDPELKFYRIILDEAHKIKNKDSKISIACRKLKAEYRWYVSGTPIQNGLFELFPAMSFLRVVAFDGWQHFESEIVKPRFAVAMKAVHGILKKYLLRRTKSATLDEKPIIILPPKEEIHVRVDFDRAQRNVYDHLESEVRLEFMKYQEENIKDTSIRAARILRLRQVCLHPKLIDFLAGDGLKDTPLDEQRLVRNAVYNFPIEHIKRILDKIKSAKLSEKDFKCEKCSQNNVTRLIPRCGHGICTQCYGDINPSLKYPSEYSPQGSCPVCSTQHECIFITTLTAFKCAWVSEFRRDEWDEEPDTKQPFNDPRYLDPLLKEIGGDEVFVTRRRFIDPRIWGPANVASIQANFINPLEDALPTSEETSQNELRYIDEQESLTKRKFGETQDSLDCNSETTLMDATPKRHCSLSTHEIKAEASIKDEKTNSGHLDRQKTPLTATFAHSLSKEEEPLFVDEPHNISSETEDISPSSTLSATAGTTEQESLAAVQFLFSPSQQDALMRASAIPEEYMALMHLQEFNRQSSAAAHHQTVALSLIPDLQLTVDNGKFDLPYNYPRLQREACQSAERKRRYMARLRNDGVPECAKITKLMEMLQAKQIEFPQDRIIIFSEFTTMLDFIELRFSFDGRNDFLRYDGTLSGPQKDEIICKFMNTRNVFRILLCSLRSGNVGLNLTAANHVIFMEPFWNPFVQDQATDRCHRMGQTKKVYVSHLIVEGTIEDRVLAIQQQKRAEVGQVLDGEVVTEVNTRLTARDMDMLVGLGGTGTGAPHGESVNESMMSSGNATGAINEDSMTSASQVDAPME